MLVFTSNLTPGAAGIPPFPASRRLGAAVPEAPQPMAIQGFSRTQQPTGSRRARQMVASVNQQQATTLAERAALEPAAQEERAPVRGAALNDVAMTCELVTASVKRKAVPDGVAGAILISSFVVINVGDHKKRAVYATVDSEQG